MNRKKFRQHISLIAIIVVSLSMTSSIAFADESTETTPIGQELVEFMLDQMKPVNTKGIMEQTIETSSGDLRTFKYESYSANKGEKTLVRYLKPASIKGQAFLILNYADDIWTYFPRTKRVRKLASHAKKQKVQGSDFTYEDMGTGDSWKFEYTPANLGATEYQDEACWELELKGIAEKEPAYSRLIIMVRQIDNYPLCIDYYNDEGDNLKSLIMEDIQEVEGQAMAMKSTMKNHEDDTETISEVISVTFKWEPKKDFFSERNLKK